MKTRRPTVSALRVSAALLFLFVSGNLLLTSALSQPVFSVTTFAAPSLQVERNSVASDGTQGNGASGVQWAYISANGRYVAFGSLASNLVPGDTNDAGDFFVYDRQTKQTERVSVASDGTQGNGFSVNAVAISADGRYVAFSSHASNLVPNDTNGVHDVFVRDRQTGQTQVVSIASDGTRGNACSGYSRVSISADGRYVAYSSFASNLVPNDTNGQEDAFVHDRQTGQTQRVSVAPNGTQGNDSSSLPYLSADGRYVVFESSASNLVSGDTNGKGDVFVHDRQTGQVTRVSIASNGTQANGGSVGGTISADGRYVVFSSDASNLVSGDTNGATDVFVHDRQTVQTIRVSVASDGSQANGDSGDARSPTISSDGTLIAFESDASNLVPGDTNGKRDVFVAKILAWSTYSVSGRVTDGSNNPIASVTVSAGAGHTTTTDSNGNYTLSGLSAGTYTITPSRRGYTFSPASRVVSVPPSKTGYDFVAIQPSPQTCAVPFFSQRDDRWITHTLRTSGGCKRECNTIGACGCTLTAAAMVFSYYGANLNPPTLSDCMGTSACPFSWGIGASCTNGKAAYIGQYAFSWSRLDQELNQNHRPVILGMCKKGTCQFDHDNDPNTHAQTHWVVVISGQGSDPASYSIHDPWFIGGANMKLSARTQNYDLALLSVYTGQLSCASTSLGTLLSSTIAQPASSALSSVVTGTALIYSMTEVTMTVQLIAQSSAGNITEMLVWTDETTNPSWQPFSTLIELPVSDHVYARFRDEFGNESGQTSDTIHPINTPRNPPFNIFLPIIWK